MLALKEFADFITLHKADLTATYARLLAESGAGYETFPVNSRLASARKLIKAVAEACETESPEPLNRLFEGQITENQRWAANIAPPQPLVEVECLGQMLTPVVTNLEAGKFLWQILAEVRARVFPAEASGPTPPSTLSRNGGEKEESSSHRAERGQVEEALRESEERFHLIVDMALDAVITMDAEGRITTWNPQAETIFGWSRQEVVGQSLADTIIPPQYREAHQRGLKHFLATREGPVLNRRIEITALHSDGHEFPVELTISPLQSGEILTFSAFIRDITERKQLEQQLRKSIEHRTHQVQVSTEMAQEIAAAPALVDLFRRIVDLIQERFGYYHVQIYILEAEDLVMQAGTGEPGRKLKEAGHKIALAAEKSLVARAARTGEPILVPNVFQEPGWLPNPLLPDTKSELSVPIKLRDKVLGVLDAQHDAHGGLTEEDQLLLMGLCGQIAVAINTRQVKAEGEQTQVVLLESEQKYRELVDTLPIGIYRNTPGPKGHFLEANPALVAMFEADSKEEFLKYNASDMYQNPEDRKVLSEKLSRLGYIKNEELRLKTLKGRDIWGAVTAVMKKEANGRVYFDGIIEDISERKRSEETAVERTRLNAFSATVGLALTQNVTLRDMLQQCTEAMVEYLEAAFARIWTLNPAENMLELQASAGMYTHLDGPHGRVPVGKFKIGLIAQERKPHLTNEVLNDPRVGDKEWAKREGMIAFAGYPLIVGDQLVGVMAMFARKHLAEEVLRLMASVANTIALSIDHKQAEAALTKRAMQLGAMAQVSAAASTILDINQLLPEVVNLIRNEFDFYYVGLFLVDETGEWAVLQAGTGEAGRIQLENNHRLAVGGQSMIGWSIQNRRARIALDVGQEAVHFQNPLLPDTHSEMALPLISRGEVIGALTVQSVERGAFSDDDLTLLQAMADQIANAIANAHLFEQAQRRAGREQTIREITEKMRAASSLEQLVKMTAEELGQRFSAEYALIDLGIDHSVENLAQQPNGTEESD